jgi:hypothetical protein
MSRDRPAAKGTFRGGLACAARKNLIKIRKLRGQGDVREAALIRSHLNKSSFAASLPPN